MISSIKHRIIKFLKWTERYTRTDMVYLARGSFWMSAKRIVYSATAFVVAFVFANYFPQEAYGEYKYLLSMAGLFAIVSMRGINTSFLRTVARGFEGTYWSAVRSRFKWGLIGVVISLGFAGYYFSQGDNSLASAFAVCAIFLAPLNAFTMFVPLLNGRKQFQLSAQYETYVQVFASSVIVATVLLTNSVLWVLGAYFVAYSVARGVAMFTVNRKYKPNKDEEEDTISYGKHLSVMAAVEDVASRIDSVLLWHYLGPVALAVYSFANVPTKHLRSLVSSTGLLALIKLSDKDPSQMKKTLPRKVGIFFLFVLPIVVVYVLAAPYLFELVFPQYLESVVYTQALALSLLFYPKILFGSALTAHADKKSLYIMNVSTPVINIALLLALLPLYGIWGVVAATLLTQVYKTAIMTVLFFRL